MENKNNKVLLTVIGAATLLVAMVGATFAYFSATSTTQTQTVTTGSASMTITASNNEVSNIKPTTFNKTNADNGSNTDIVKIDLTISTTSTSAGKFNVVMNEPAITLNAGKTGGVVGDIKYAVYDSTGTQVGSTGSFTGTAQETTILSNVDYAAGNAVETTYSVYVWIENQNTPQDALQDVSFDLTFTADATTAL